MECGREEDRKERVGLSEGGKRVDEERMNTR